MHLGCICKIINSHQLNHFRIWAKMQLSYKSYQCKYICLTKPHLATKTQWAFKKIERTIPPCCSTSVLRHETERSKDCCRLSLRATVTLKSLTVSAKKNQTWPSAFQEIQTGAVGFAWTGELLLNIPHDQSLQTKQALLYTIWIWIKHTITNKMWTLNLSSQAIHYAYLTNMLIFKTIQIIAIFHFASIKQQSSCPFLMFVSTLVMSFLCYLLHLFCNSSWFVC